MPTLTNSASFTVIAATPVSESVQVRVLPLSAGSSGTGRLVHPTLGTLDYPYAPDVWEGVDTDVLVPPVWSYAPTLSSGVNSLWAGNIKDVTPMERWTSEVSMPMAFVRSLLNFWMNPPDPATGFVLWSPSYVNSLTYKVILSMVSSNGTTLTFSYISRQQWLEGDLQLNLRVVDYA